MGSDPKIAPTLAATDVSETLVKPLSGRHARVDARVSTVIDGRYLIESVLGEGGMGIVYRARHRLLDQIVAMKVLRGEMARSEEMVDRFLHEARIASSIKNPHLVTVSDFGVLDDGATYFVMEHLDGVNLTRILKEQTPLSIPRVLHIGKQIARGVGAAHTAGIVHRDLKPDNVMLVEHDDDKDFVKILDFGIAKIATRVTTMTAAGGMICGTPHYMSPEQAAGDAVDKHSDIYALGVMLYEMTSGHVPFDSESVIGLIAAHVNRAPPSLASTSKRTDIPPSLEALIMRCLAKKIEDRYPSMEAVADDLEAIDDDLVFAAVNEAPPLPSTGIRMRDLMPQPKKKDAKPPPVRRNSGAMNKATTPPKAAGTIIVVDDSEICREIATLMLTEEGFEVIALADPSTLSDALGATQPSLVLVDVTMPGMGGEALVRKMRKDCGVQCPMVLHSDLPEEKLIELARSCEAAGYIRKTADARRFSEQLRKYLGD